MRVPILTYHSNNVLGHEYAQNDHVALLQDLQLIHSLGHTVIPLSQLVDWVLGHTDTIADKPVVLTCDDGSWFDFFDMPHPTLGMQTGFFNILKKHQLNTGHKVHMSSFVIASPEARTELDQKCLIGKNWWSDVWWKQAQESGIFSIENHSWNHNHPMLQETCNTADSFTGIESQQAADEQIQQAQQYIESVCQYRPRYLAFPYGDYSPYIVNEYLPNHQSKHSLDAAFTTERRYVEQGMNRWTLPRFVCGEDWKSVADLKKILTA